MSKFVLHPEVYSDLNEIWEYIAADNLDAADRVLDEIYDAITSLVHFPHIGHSRPDLTSQPLRFQVVRDYVIAYAPDEKPLADCYSAWPPQSACAGSDTESEKLTSGIRAFARNGER
jgi:plasmid stabilization system protein ParE